jgi:hypothetical protein
MLYAIQAVLGINFIATMELFVYRSVKNINFAAFKGPVDFAFQRGCEIDVFYGSSFYAS